MGIPLDSNRRFAAHPSDEILEEYVFHRLPEALATQVEEHLLICTTCQDAVVATDQFIAALKVSAGQPPPPETIRSGWRDARLSLVPIFALVILVLMVPGKHPQEDSTPVAVTLSSVRGTGLLAPAPAQKPLQLNIEAPDFAPGNGYKVEVADAAGRMVWTGAARDTGGKLAASMPKSLSPGVYWVRLYDADSDLLREFGIAVK